MKITKTFFEDIRGLIHSARTTVARGVDLVQVYTNFEIGRRIVEQEQKGKGRAAYGQEVIRQLADRLTEEFGRGYSKRSLELMRQFYFFNSERGTPIVQTLSAQLPISSTYPARSCCNASSSSGEMKWKVENERVEN